MTDQKPPAPIPPKTRSTLEQLQELADKLSPTERRALSDAGAYIPPTASGVLKGVRNKGYHCKNCGNIAFEFVGEKWEEVMADGTVRISSDVPEIAWVELPLCPPDDAPKNESGQLRHPILRKSNPRCCHCGCQVAKSKGGTLGPRSDYVVDLAPFRRNASMDKQTKRQRIAKFMKEDPQGASRAGAQ